MRILELFGGTGGVGRTESAMGHTVLSLDTCSKYKPDLLADIMEFDFTIWTFAIFDYTICRQIR